MGSYLITPYLGEVVLNCLIKQLPNLSGTFFVYFSLEILGLYRIPHFSFPVLEIIFSLDTFFYHSMFI